LTSAFTEGDLSQNAKLWYEQVDPKILAKHYGDDGPIDAARAFVERTIEAHKQRNSPSKDEQLEKRVREEKWAELVKIMEELEGMHGWKAVDGLQFYTKDEDPSHKSNVLGERGSAVIFAWSDQIS
jgi:hypothetical protein